MTGETTVRAGVMLDGRAEWEVVDLRLDEPRAHEVRMRFHAAGLCHSDHHVTQRDFPTRLPIVGGHEGAGVVEAVGPDVTRVRPGDRVVCSYIPACGTCRPCSTGHENVCVKGANAMTGAAEDGTFRFHLDDASGTGTDLGGFCGLGTFAQRAVVSEWACLPLPDDIGFDVGALLGCGVPTGWGSAVNAADVRPGQTVVVYGVGGIGINAVQGARSAGARYVVAVDPVAFKRETALTLGATHATGDAEEAHRLVQELTWGVGADTSIVTVGRTDSEVVDRAFSVIGKAGTLVLTSMGGGFHDRTIQLPGQVATLWKKTVKGSLFGDCNPTADIPRLLGLYRSGDLKLDELVSRTIDLDGVNDAFEAMQSGELARSVIKY